MVCERCGESFRDFGFPDLKVIKVKPVEKEMLSNIPVILCGDCRRQIKAWLARKGKLNA